MSQPFEMIAKTFFGLENVLADELRALGAADVRPGRRMVAFRGDAVLMVRANLHCRTAVRVLKPILHFTAGDEQALYRGLGLIDWREHLDADGSLAIDPVVRSTIFTNSLYAAQKAKDAIVDQFRAATGRRPSVDLEDPDLRINLYIDQDRATVYLDSSGDSLHKRGYRGATGEAPLNEVLAAGILALTGWDRASPLADFMCGSGTLVIEAAMAARRIVPGLVRRRFGYLRWKGFDRSPHDAALAEAAADVLPALDAPLQASDLDPRAIAAARENARRAGVEQDIDFLVANFDAVRPPAAEGVLVSNPPYDERMKVASLARMYRRLGDALKRHWGGYAAYILTGHLDAGPDIGLRPGGSTRLFNGPIECRLLRFKMFATDKPTAEQPDDESAPRSEPAPRDEATEFANRLTRMARHWHRWARRQGITCYRLYDRDVADVPLSIDWYEGHLVIAEHARPHGRTELEHAAWLQRIVAVAGSTLEVPAERVTVASRMPATKEKKTRAREPRWIEAHEGGATYLVDPARAEIGLPLDQRTLRSMLAGEAAGKRVLNLFARSAALSVAAVLGGAAETTSVEASPTLVEWARRNLKLAGADAQRHRVIESDPLALLRELPADGLPAWDLAVVAPPGFDGRRREGIWNVQDGHVELLNGVLEHLAPGGKLYFVTPFRRLTFRTADIRGATVREITRQTVPPDFRNKKVHRAWSLIRAAGVPASGQMLE